MFNLQEDFSEYDEYMASVPIISQAMESVLDRIIGGMALEFGFETTKAFAQSIIDDELPPDMLVIYNDRIGHVIEEFKNKETL